MNNIEVIEILKEAQRKIEELRRNNQILSAKVDVMDGFFNILHKGANTCSIVGYEPDIYFTIEKCIAELSIIQPGELKEKV